MESSKINRQNYEVFIVDYLDGNLGPVESAELLLFLELNPDIKKEVEGLSGAILDQEPVPEYPFKEALKPAYDTDAVHITGENNTYYFIAYHEGDLSETGMQNVNEYLSKNPEFLSAFEAFRMSRLSSDSRIKYPEPGKLKKIVPLFRTRFLYYSSVAASVLILISIFFRLQPESRKEIFERIMVYETASKNDTKPVSNEGKSEFSKPEPIPSEPVKEAVAENRKPERIKQPVVRLQSFEMASIPTGIIPAGRPDGMNPRNEFSGLVEAIHQSQEMLLAYDETREEGGRGREFSIGKRLPAIIQGGAQLRKQLPEAVNGWMLADIGISGFNLLTDNELKLEREINNEGKTENVRLLDGEMAYSFRKNQN